MRLEPSRKVWMWNIVIWIDWIFMSIYLQLGMCRCWWSGLCKRFLLVWKLSFFSSPTPKFISGRRCKFEVERFFFFLFALQFFNSHLSGLFAERSRWDRSVCWMFMDILCWFLDFFCLAVAAAFFPYVCMDFFLSFCLLSFNRFIVGSLFFSAVVRFSHLLHNKLDKMHSANKKLF